jgi:hypothetical protein
MNTTKSTEAKISLANFDFDTREVALIHRQFSGERTQFISTIDELLRCWAMADSANPKIQFNYTLLSRTQDGKTVSRQQFYSADHASVFFQFISEPMKMDPCQALLRNPKQLVKLYDLAFADARPTLPAHTVASYFTLREVLARMAEYATSAEITDTQLFVLVTDGDDKHFAVFNLPLFGSLLPFAQQLNTDQAQ